MILLFTARIIYVYAYSQFLFISQPSIFCTKSICCNKLTPCVVMPACSEPLSGNAKLPGPHNDCWGCSLKNGKEIHCQGGKKLGMKLPFALIDHGVRFWWEDMSFLTEHRGCLSGPQREVTFPAGYLCPPHFQLPPSGQLSPCALITVLIRRFLPILHFSHRLRPFPAGSAFAQVLPGG